MAGLSDYRNDAWQYGSQMRLYPIFESIDTDIGEISMELDFGVIGPINNNTTRSEWHFPSTNNDPTNFGLSTAIEQASYDFDQLQIPSSQDYSFDVDTSSGSCLLSSSNTLPTPTYNNWHGFHLDDDYMMTDVSNEFDDAHMLSDLTTKNVLESDQPPCRHDRPPRFTDAQTNFLRAWVENNIDVPYPTSEEITYLRMATGLEVLRIRNWFSRYRQRKHVMPLMLDTRAISDCGSAVAQSSLVVAPSTRASSGRSDNGGSSCGDAEIEEGYAGDDERAGHISSHSSNTHEPEAGREDLNHGSENILTWWLQHLPQKLLDRAELELDSFPHPWTISHPPGPGRPEERLPFYWAQTRGTSDPLADSGLCDRTGRDVKISNNGEPSSDSFETSSENGYSTTSGISGTSLPSGYRTTSSVSAYSSILHGSRKGRKRRPYNAAITGTASRSSGQTSGREAFLPYQCTYCKKGFSRKFCCKRHEQAVHQPITVWICQPLSQAVPGEEETCCYLCNEPEQSHRPSNRGVCTHNIRDCHKKSEGDRTFFRRDNFVQHLQGMHKMTTEQIQQIDTVRWERKLDVQEAT